MDRLSSLIINAANDCIQRAKFTNITGTNHARRFVNINVPV